MKVLLTAAWLCALLAISNIYAAMPPTGGTIAVSDNSICVGDAAPTVTFTPTGSVSGTITFNYTLDGAPLTATGNPATGQAILTNTPGSHTYVLLSIQEASGTPVSITGQSVTITVHGKPSVTFTNNANASTCSGSPVNFDSTVTGGTPPYQYTWDFDDSGTSTADDPTHTFNPVGCATHTFQVKLTVVDAKGCSSTQVTSSVTIKDSPDVNFIDVNNPNFNSFSNCQNAAANPIYSVTVGNAATSACVTSYTIDWADGSPVQSNPTFPASHTYNQRGTYNLTITAFGANGCTTKKNYLVKNISNPSGGITSPGSTQNLCAPTSLLQFAISNWGTNSDDSVYEVDYGDNTPFVYLNQIDMKATSYYNNANPAASSNYPIPHSYTSSTCPSPTVTAKLKVTNACSSTSGTVSDISVLSKPIANFTNSPAACVNTAVTFSNTTVSGYSMNCEQSSFFTWNFGDGSPIINTPLQAPQNITHVFAIPGNYSVTLKAEGYCGSTTITKQICIESPITPSFTLNTASGCGPVSVTATNTTSVTASCNPPVYKWEVSYASGFCGSGAANIPDQTTQNASYTFTTPGTYTVKLTMSNSCGSFSSTKTVEVKRPPEVSINAIADSCGTATITPTASVQNCASTSGTLSYNWSFPGGSPASSTSATPPSVTYTTAGSHTVSLVVTNECGPSATATRIFNVNQAPSVSNTALTQSVCSGMSTAPVTLTSTLSGTTFSWTAVATTGISGFTASGSGDIPAQVLTTTNASTGTVTYHVTPSQGSCQGAPVDYIVTVNPAPSFAAPLAGETLCQGGTPAALNAVLNNAPGATYQWHVSNSSSAAGAPVASGGTSASYTPPATPGTKYYYCVVSLPASAGCSQVTSNYAEINVVALPTVSAEPLATQDVCLGTAATPLTVAYSGGTGTPSYQWYLASGPSDTVGTPISLATAPTYSPPTTTVGTSYYFVKMSFTASGCTPAVSAKAIVNVGSDPQISVQPITSQEVCEGAVPATLSVTATGTTGFGALSYQWYKDTNNDGVGGTPVGNNSSSYTPVASVTGTSYYYCIISQSAAGCETTSAVSQLDVNPAPVFSTQPQPASICQGGTIAALTVAVSNGVGTPTYQWFKDTDASPDATAVPVGSDQPSYTPDSMVIGSFWYYCQATFAGGGGCSSIVSLSAQITVTGAAAIDDQPEATQTVCVGGTIPIALTASYTGGTGSPSWQWYSNTAPVATGGQLISGATSATYIPPAFTTTGNFYFYAVLTLSGGGCGTVTTAVATVTVVPDPVVTTQPLATQSLCAGSVPQPLLIVASGGNGAMSYQWYESGTNSPSGGTPVGTDIPSFIPPTTVQGTKYYYCTVTQSGSGCAVTSQVAEVIVIPSPSLSSPSPATLCLGEPSPTLSVTLTNPIGTPQYQWFSNNTPVPGGSPIPSATNPSYTPPVSAAGTTYYYVEVTLPTGGCSSLTSTVAAVEVNPYASISAKTATICSGNSFAIMPTNGSDTVPTGTTYSWPNPVVSPPGSVTGAGAMTGQSSITQTLSNTTTSPAVVTYSVTPLTGTCTGPSFTVTVTVNPGVMSNVTVVDSPCFAANAGSLQTNITGGIPFSSGNPYQLTWSGPDAFTSTATSISGLAPGVYTLDVTDAGGCPVAEQYTILEPADIVITVDLDKDVTCFGSDDGAVSVSLSGGTVPYSVSWTKNTAPFALTEDISALAPGTYEVTVSDAHNCGPKVLSFTITEPPVLDASLLGKVDILCNGASTGAIMVSVSGGTPFEPTPGVFEYQYLWNGPNGFTATTQDLSAVPAGTYHLIVTDASGCTDTLQVILTEPPGIVITAVTTPISCYNANDASITLTITGGTAPYTIAWSNLATGTFQDNLAAGTYTITVTDATSCPKVLPVVIDQAPLFDVTPLVSEISCFGANNGSINLNFVGGIAPVVLVWSDGSTAGTQRNNLGPGTYSVTITDSKPCVITRSFTLVEPQPLVLAATVVHAIDCDDANSGAIDLMVSGGSPPFTYAWTNGGSAEDLTAIPAGNYGITVTDSRGCSKTATYVVNRQAPLVAHVATQSDFDCETHDVRQTFLAQVTGGVPPYELEWSSGSVSGANNEIMETEQEGTVMLDVTDGQGCTTNYSFNVDIPVLGDAAFEQQSIAYETYGYYSIQDPIQFTNTATGDFVSIAWDFGDGSFSTEENPSHTYVREAEYVIKQTVTYPFGCTYTRIITLLVDKGYELMIPNAFTPNGDGLNDTFVPVYKGLDSIELEIYTTWGEKIYYEKGATIAGWRGEVKDIESENGNYYYKITATTFYNGVVIEKGPLVLLK